jgi:hypothetical protein
VTAADETPALAGGEPTDAEVEAFSTAWEAERVSIGRGIVPKGTKTRAGLRAAFAERERAEEAASEPCREELYSWDYFRPEQTDPYWMRCGLVGPHEEHDNSDTGAKWKTM